MFSKRRLKIYHFLLSIESVVKTKDDTIAKEYGIEQLPALIYFEKRIPSIYEGDISAEEDVLQWLIQQKTEDTIESVNRELLEQLISNTQYLVVYFCKRNNFFFLKIFNEKKNNLDLLFFISKINQTARRAILFWKS